MKTVCRKMGMPKCFLFVFLGALALAFVVHAQVPSAFISIDCGISEDSSYTDETTGIPYISDAAFIDSGVIKTISPEFKTNSLQQQFLNVRSFPEGTRNCYTVRAERGRGNKYLIRAWFMYGNYDAQDKPPTFELYIGVDFWDRISLFSSSTIMWSEIIHVLSSDYIYVCLQDKRLGTPFMSALELRPLNNSMYETTSGSLLLFDRLDFGSTTKELVRFKDDAYDRVWNPTPFMSNPRMIRNLSTMNSLASNLLQIPSSVMSTAITSQNASDSLNLWWFPSNSSDQFYIYMHFAEVEVLQHNQSREFYIYINGTRWLKEPVVPDYFSANTIYSTKPVSFEEFNISINKTKNSTLPPIINGLEIYTVRQIIHSQTDDEDVSAILGIKLTYGVKRVSWQGDPCVPEDFVWVGLTCSYDGFSPARITSLNLSSSGLTGEISAYISNLTVIKSLDLSNNKLTGQVPNFLSQLTLLTFLNLRGNNFTGPVPEQLLEKSKNGSLLLSIDATDQATENTNPCQSIPCEKKKNKVVVPVIASVTALSVLLIAIGSALWIIEKRKQVIRKQKDGTFDVKNREFTYSEVLSITNNFQRIIGKGGFGTVYHGNLRDTQVAVKMLSSSSIQGYKEFQAEAKLLMSVHHKNLTSLVGYCNEGTNLGIVYEYMANGDLESHLSDRNPNVLSWEERLRIAADAAQGLEYLHHGCKPPIIHRDVKSTNILLNEKFQAKLADFGLSRIFPTEVGTHVWTVVAGTPGYLDPEYFMSQRLTEKSDVYSFGIVILEIITGQPSIPKSPDSTHIIEWVSSMLENGDVKSIVDPKLQEDYNVNSVWKVVELAMACVSRTSTKRPTMNYVAIELKECLGMELAQHESDQSKDSIAMIPMNLESGVSPMAR